MKKLKGVLKEPNPIKLLRFTLLVLIFSVLFFVFRTKLYFYFDEWDIIPQLKSFSLEGVLTPHNEHFQPLFHLVYSIEIKLFNLNHDLFYLCHVIIHILNLIILWRILDHLNENRIINSLLIVLVGLSGVYYDVILWTMMTSLILNLTFLLLAILLHINFAKSKNYKFLLGSAFTIFLSQFCFGSSILLPITFLFFPLFSLLKDKSALKNLKLHLKNLLRYTPYLIVNIAYITLYLIFAKQNLFRHNSNWVSHQTITCIIPYILRGLSGFTSEVLFANTEPLELLALSLVVVLGTLAIAIYKGFKREAKYATVIFLFSTVVVIYATIAATRCPFGITQSLSGRYMYIPMFLLVPAVTVVLSGLINQVKGYTLTKSLILSSAYIYLVTLNFGLLYYKAKDTWEPLTKTILQHRDLVLHSKEINLDEKVPPEIHPGKTNQEFKDILEN